MKLLRCFPFIYQVKIAYKENYKIKILFQKKSKKESFMKR